jgi:hypothetical protein
MSHTIIRTQPPKYRLWETSHTMSSEPTVEKNHTTQMKGELTHQDSSISTNCSSWTWFECWFSKTKINYDNVNIDWIIILKNYCFFRDDVVLFLQEFTVLFFLKMLKMRWRLCWERSSVVECFKCVRLLA